MLRTVLSALFLLALLPVASAAAEKRVWRIDSIVTTREPDAIVIQVKGAVQSGGWKKPRLRLTRTDNHTLTVEFLAQPPQPGETVITGLLPVTAALRVKGAQGMLAVKAVGDANEVTAQILNPEH